MAASDAPWQECIPPGDPRYESWLLVRGFTQSGESTARADFWRTVQTKGRICLDDVLRLTEQSFDAVAKALAITVSGTESAEICVECLDELVRRTVIAYSKWFLLAESAIGMSAASLETQVKLRLGTRVEFWKAEAFRFGLESEISRVKKKSSEGTSSSAVIGDGKREFLVSCWQDLEISFFNEYTVQITAGSEPITRDFGALGLAQKRSGKPMLAWHMLHELAKADGVLRCPTSRSHNWTMVEKRMQELRAWLRRLFNISADPIPFAKGTGYRAEFKISCAPSYRE